MKKNELRGDAKFRLKKQLDEIATLRDNWDGYGAKAPSPQAIDNARRFIELKV